MKQFFKFMLASMTGFFLGAILLFFLLLAVISGLMMSIQGDKKVAVSDNSVLEINFEDPIKERTSNNPFEDLNFSNLKADRSPGLDQILKSIAKAKADDRIKGLFLDLTLIQAGMATIEEIRQALLDFKKSQKFIYAYSESYSQGAYYLASLADKIYIYPQGDLDFKGLRVNLMFFKGTLEKLEIKPEIIRHGKFKSAVEPFMYDNMSPENREQISTFINGIWNNVLDGISASRNISRSTLQQIADSLSARKPEDALRLKLVDKIAFYDEVLSDLKKKTGLEEKEKVKLKLQLSLQDFL